MSDYDKAIDAIAQTLSARHPFRSWLDVLDDAKAVYSSLAPLGSADRAELIRVGAQGIASAYGVATIKKATSVVDALLARYDIRPKE